MFEVTNMGHMRSGNISFNNFKFLPGIRISNIGLFDSRVENNFNFSNSKESFLKLDMWLNDVKQLAIPGIKIFLVGNKYDLNNERQVSYEEGERYKNDKNLDYFVEASAKLGFNTEKIFKKAAMVLYREYQEFRTDNTSIATATFRADNTMSFTIARNNHKMDKKDIKGTPYKPRKSSSSNINNNNNNNEKCEC
jgi:GTPase SAR1 family protein